MGTEDMALPDMLMKSEGDRNSPLMREGRKASEHILLTKPSATPKTRHRIGLPFNKSSSFPTRRKFSSQTNKQTGRERMGFRMLISLLQLEDGT